MQFDLITLFPDFFESPLRYGVVARAILRGALTVRTHHLRGYAGDRHQTTDDRPYGGGEGMVMKIEPLYRALAGIAGAAERSVRAGAPDPARVILLSAQGRLFDQAMARRLAGYRQLVLICGRYEGVDERVAEHLADEEISIGNFVLTGGELAAAVLLDAVARLLPGVLGDAQSALNESFSLPEPAAAPLDCPHYTRPPEFNGWPVPQILLQGDHQAIRDWRARAAWDKTRRLRADLCPAKPDE